MSAIPVRRSAETTWLWLAKIATGVAIFAILIVHLIVNHLVAPGGLLTYNDVLRYYSNPIIPIMEGLFLIFVVSHALLGLRGIVLDLSPGAVLLRWLDRLFIGVGTVAIGYGLWLLVTLATRAATV